MALAVSGGSDSLALLLLALKARKSLGFKLAVATVDHGLRSEARAEAEHVAALCAHHGVSHEILTWDGEKPTANLQAAARQARSGLLAEWRSRVGLRTLALGHTLDDVAETFLMRLARGSGVDGLARMREAREQVEFGGSPPLRLIRPLLSVRREVLKDYCRREGVSWVDDPSNDDERFLRSKARSALSALAPLGLGVETLAKTAVSMERAREALEAQTIEFLRRAAQADQQLGLVVFAPEAFAKAPREVSLRALARMLEWVSGAVYPPRLEALEAALDGLMRGESGRSLHGALLAPLTADPAGRWTVFREPEAMQAAVPTVEGAAVWDSRFELRGAPPGAVFGPMGEDGRVQIEKRFKEADDAPPPGWKLAPIAARRAAPAVRDAQENVIHAPSAGVVLKGLSLSPLRIPSWEGQRKELELSVER